MSIVDEAPGYIQVFSDGTVKRFSPEIADASAESTDGFKSKDVVIDPSKPITGRIYVPDLSPELEQVELLPVLLYFHGGGFCVGSTSWLGYHLFLGSLSVQSKSVVVSVDYRLAPENKLPIAYEDCYAALEWIRKNQKADPCLERADLSCVFLSGDSAGGNIVHQVHSFIPANIFIIIQEFLHYCPSSFQLYYTLQVAKKSLRDGNCAVKIKGIMPIHPYFGSEKRTELEMAEGSSGISVAMNDMFWRLSLPEGASRDFYGCNFENDRELSVGEWLSFPAAMVFVAGMDFLKERGVMYAEFLRRKGVQWVEVVEAEGEGHVFHVFHPDSEPTRLLQKQMSEFIHRHGHGV